jgi:hypothetical protein
MRVKRTNLHTHLATLIISLGFGGHILCLGQRSAIAQKYTSEMRAEKLAFQD